MSDKILVAFSGGPDSVYLYHYLKKRGYSLTICYVNHNYRNDVKNDIDFVINFAKENNCQCLIKELNLKKFNENDAREKRYELLEDARRQADCKYIATGHNKNDNVETILFRLIRGTGLEGLKGIKPIRDNIIRPILNISKEDILDYLEKNNHKYLIDYTNFENNYSRNIIRNEIFPIMKRINSDFIDNIANFIQILNEENKLSEYIINELKKYNIKYNKNKITQIINIKNSVGKKIKLDERYVWYSSYNYYGIIENEIKKEKEVKININEQIYFNDYHIIFSDDFNNKNYLEKKGYKIYNIPNVNELTIRPRKTGDRIGNKKIKHLFINHKIDSIKRDLIPLIVCENEIIAIADILYKLNNKICNIRKYIAIRREN